MDELIIAIVGGTISTVLGGLILKLISPKQSGGELGQDTMSEVLMSDLIFLSGSYFLLETWS